MIKKVLSAALLLCILFSVCSFAAPSPWAVGEVETANRNGLVPETLLSDYQNAITREEFCSMAILLYEKLAGKDAPAGDAVFTDTQSANVSSAYALGIVKGISETQFAPASLITREEIAAMFQRAIAAALPDTAISSAFVNTFPDADSISSWATDSVKFVNMCEIMLGDEFGNINPKNNTTREQAIAMVLRIYDAFRKGDSSILDFYGFKSSGNTTTNMENGAFAIKSLEGKLYLSDDSGIYESPSNEYITKNKANGIYVEKDCIYYINAADSALYSVKLSDKTETKIFDDAVSFSTAGEYIYIKNSENDLIALSTKTNKAVTAAENVTSIPLAAATSVYYGNSDGIYSYKPETAETTEIYKGEVSDPVLVNSVFYFKNAEGYVCSMSISADNVKVITPVPANDYCVYSGAVAYTTDDGVYKRDLSGKFNIKLSEDANLEINSYEKTLYLKSADGKISAFNVYTGEKTPLN